MNPVHLMQRFQTTLGSTILPWFRQTILFRVRNNTKIYWSGLNWHQTMINCQLWSWNKFDKVCSDWIIQWDCPKSTIYKRYAFWTYWQDDNRQKVAGCKFAVWNGRNNENDGYTDTWRQNRVYKPTIKFSSCMNLEHGIQIASKTFQMEDGLKEWTYCA